jgi:hypothetical protein
MSMGRRRVAWRWVSLGLLLIAAPLLLFPGGWRSMALLVLPLIWINNRTFTGHFVPRTPYDGVILCLLVMVLVSLYPTYDIAVSLPKIAGVLLGVSAFYVMVNLADTADHLRRLLMSVFLMLAILSGFLLVGTDWGRKIPALEQIGALLPTMVRGLPGADGGFHLAEVGGTLTWIMFLPVAAFIGLWPYHRSGRGIAALIGLGGLSAVLGAALVLTQSRSVWLGCAAGAVVIRYGSGNVSLYHARALSVVHRQSRCRSGPCAQ